MGIFVAFCPMGSQEWDYSLWLVQWEAGNWNIARAGGGGSFEDEEEDDPRMGGQWRKTPRW
eukprot:CAMPEP_0198209998 /NCGR_PEP_ID=MMETSP1445-20131203/18194_1 /TAXON_ID=36898 /ORGANISM="Pyramimonas sp., Strain CCMP2087" /LENGTH=60 /DNA_ID=CAMNT_0043883929 /DNA_START=341 /DNA_END=520 /DNA_ORIENTATION=-